MKVIQKKADAKEWLGLAVLVFASLLVSIDLFVLVLALPYLSIDLKASSVEQIWIMDIYGFMLAGFLITMGTLGDRIGRRKLLLIGATAFGLASVLSAFSINPEMLIMSRALLGIAGATIAPSTLALISTMFSDSKQRGIAISIWMAGFMGGAAIGPLIGGVLLANYWWGSVFLLGVPAMIVLVLLGPVLLPEYRNTNAGRLDLFSVFLSLASILPLIYGFKEIANYGWNLLNFLLILAGLGISVVFVKRQRTLTNPLLDLRLFSDRILSTAIGGQLAGTMLLGIIMLLVTQYLQLVKGLPPLQTALWMLPAVCTQMISFLISPMIAQKIRPAYLIGGGLAVSVSGLLLLSQVEMNTGLTLLVIGYALTTIGSGPLMTLSPNMIIGSAPPERAGSAGGLSQTSAEFGFALGLAVLGSISTAVYRNRMADSIPQELPNRASLIARDNIAGAIEVSKDIPNSLGHSLLTIAREAFTFGMNTVAVVSAVLLFVVAVIIVTMLRHVNLSTGSTDNQSS
ncbi:MFS transporter [Neobacillus massiliamazoniensis]|uniref:Major facilitator superfamily protein n=1 Tax=Neobacillus massiliamazoniensis TaxID=1499688 RepID=A0A0U1NZ69_9BACI|nr:MFS transporter [Neobacillus massiliamazoniensis]CRK83320.1 major facilitator superfamily protein [Neobacillus massiliamazoniensis]